MRRMKKILWENRFFFIALLILFFFNLKFDFYYIKTGSMEPVLPVGSIAVVDVGTEVQVGDIFAYQNGRNVVIHRVVAADEDGYTFKGDANPSQDAAKVTGEQLVGKVVVKIKLLAWWIKWMRGL